MGFLERESPFFVYRRAESGPFFMVAATRCPQRLTAFATPPVALSVRSRDVRGPIVTRGVALGGLRGASQTLALSR